VKSGVCSQASGSAYLEAALTKVICSVSGPRQKASATQYSQDGQLSCDFRFASFSCSGQRRKIRGEETDEKEFSLQVVQALENAVRLDRYPKSVIHVNIIVLQNSGGVLAAALICASVALADAGIEMFDLVSACSACQIRQTSPPSSTKSPLRPNDGMILLDPDEVEERFQSAGLTLALMPNLNQVTQIFQTGEMEYAKTTDAIQLCLDGCKKIYSLMTRSLVEGSARKLRNTPSASVLAESDTSSSTSIETPSPPISKKQKLQRQQLVK